MSKFDAAQLFSVKGLVAVVTGASSGLGEVMAHALDVNGAAKVFILGRRESKLQEVAAKSVRNDYDAPNLTSLLNRWLKRRENQGPYLPIVHGEEAHKHVRKMGLSFRLSVISAQKSP